MVATFQLLDHTFWSLRWDQSSSRFWQTAVLKWKRWFIFVICPKKPKSHALPSPPAWMSSRFSNSTQRGSSRPKLTWTPMTTASRSTPTSVTPNQTPYYLLLCQPALRNSLLFMTFWMMKTSGSNGNSSTVKVLWRMVCTLHQHYALLKRLEKVQTASKLSKKKLAPFNYHPYPSAVLQNDETTVTKPL